MDEKPTYEELEKRVLELEQAVSETKQTREALRESKQIIEGILNAIPVRVFWKDKDLAYLGCNTLFASDAGFVDPKEMIGKDDYQMVWREQAESYRGDDREVIESGSAKLLIEEPQTTPEGKTLALLTSKIPLYNSSGEISGILGTYMDITERKRTEDELKANEIRFRNLIEGSIQGILVHRDHKPLFVNQAWASIHGYTTEEILKMDSVVPLISPGDQERMLKFKEARLRGEDVPAHYEYQGIRKDGSPIWLENRVMTVDWKGVPAVQTIIVDISERKRVEENLKENEAKYRMIFENSKDAIYTISLEGRLVAANQSFLDFFGLTPAEIPHFKAEDFYVNPGDRSRFAKEVEKEGYAKDFEQKLRKKDGTQVYCLVTATARKSADGSILDFQGILRDITEEKNKQAEREKMIDELQSALAEVKTLSGLLPICSICNKIKDDNGYWNKIEAYIQDHSYAQFSHSICKECAEKHYPGMKLYDN